ncbi:hypothetical protein [Streptomyces sp. NPDC056049]|uniref:hypothetical protein n=1 Tax=Streptomyces sp. NPDC056049 TaxID=3345693 RepID=UPI0035E13813
MPAAMPIAIDLPPPDVLRHHWAVAAAVYAVGFEDAKVGADGHRWVYGDGGGSWVVLTRLDGDRAVLVGNDRTYSETYFRFGAQNGLGEVDLLAGLPAWAASGIPSDLVGPVGFVYAYTDGCWWRASYDAADGFARLAPPMLGDNQLLGFVVSYVADSYAWEYADEDDDTDYAKVDSKALAAAVAAGPDLTRDQLRALVPFPALDLDRGIAAAAAFRTP